MIAKLLGVERDITLLVVANLIWGIGGGLYAAIWPIFVERLGASPAEIGLTLSLATAFSVLVFIPGAALARRMGRKRAMVLGWLMGPLSSAVFGVATRWEHLLPGIVLLALVGLQTPAYLGYIVNAVPNRDLPRVYSLMASALSLGTVVSSPIGGRLADAVDMRVVFWGVCAAYTVSLLCILLLAEQLEGPTPRPLRGGREPTFRAAFANYAAIFTDTRLMKPLALQLVLLAGANLAQPLAPNWLVGAYGYSLTELGVLGAVAALASVGWSVALGRLASRRGTGAAVVASATLVVLGALALLGAASFAIGVVAHVLRGAFPALRAVAHGVTASLLRPTDATSPNNGANGASGERPPGYVDRGFAVYSILLNLALTASTFTAGVLYAVNPALPFALSAASVVPVAAVIGAAAAGARLNRVVIRARTFG